MPRRPDPQRKPQLIVEILDHLQDKPLASVSFRTIAQALGFSTYTLVYHFGTRANLLREIVAAASTRATGIEERLQANPASLDVYFEGLRMSWEWTLEPRNRQLQRLEFEAALIEAVEPQHHTFSRALYQNWLQIGEAALLSLGLTPEDAALETRITVDTFFGVQYDFVLNDDAVRASLAFDAIVARHRERLVVLIAEAGLSSRTAPIISPAQARTAAQTAPLTAGRSAIQSAAAE
ncbi:MAG TPA: TetR/AcrR family transcriptional regulator [Galbitalea sp.]|jgi:AcrR family transcriptional regulator